MDATVSETALSPIPGPELPGRRESFGPPWSAARAGAAPDGERVPVPLPCRQGEGCEAMARSFYEAPGLSVVVLVDSFLSFDRSLDGNEMSALADEPNHGTFQMTQ